MVFKSIGVDCRHFFLLDLLLFRVTGWKLGFKCSQSNIMLQLQYITQVADHRSSMAQVEGHSGEESKYGIRHTA